MKRLVIIDNDTGVDDAWALFLLINASDIDILAVTCVNGNTTIDNVCKNNLLFLSTVGRCEIPVFKGASSQLIPPDTDTIPKEFKHFHGINGFGDVPLPPVHSNVKVQSENAIVALERLTSKFKGEVSLICCGPLTNIALAIRTYPEFATNVREIYIMGGNYTAMGNVTRCAEFNFHSDPEAAHIVLSAMEKKTVILPWEACLTPNLSFEYREELGKKGGTALELINKIEKPIIETLKKLNYTSWLSPDALIAAAFIDGSLIEHKFTAHATVELNGSYTRGQLVIDHINTMDHNVTIIKSIYGDIYKNMLYSATARSST